MARTGARVIVDDVFLGGAASQERWRGALTGLEVLWVGVRCEGPVAAGREIARGDRARGMAASQAELVHRGVAYDLEVDTTHTESPDCARAIAARIERPRARPSTNSFVRELGRADPVAPGRGCPRAPYPPSP